MGQSKTRFLDRPSAGRSLSSILVLLLFCAIGPSCDQETFSTMDIAVESGVFPDFVIEIRGPSIDRRFEKSDLELNEFGYLQIPVFFVQESGVIEIEVTVTDQGRLVVGGNVAIELARNYVWHVRLWRGPVLRPCFCSGSEVFLIEPDFRETPEDHLMIAWSGDPRGSDIIR